MTVMNVDNYGDGEDGGNDFGYANDVTVTLVMAMMIVMTFMMAMMVTMTMVMMVVMTLWLW